MRPSCLDLLGGYRLEAMMATTLPRPSGSAVISAATNRVLDLQYVLGPVLSTVSAEQDQRATMASV
jgi:hypothetical protein